jgi:hypothetical protein
MTNPSFTQDQLTALESAIADGALKVKYSDKEVEYRSLGEMLKIRDIMRNDLGLNKACSKSKGLFGGKRLHMEHSKGLT